MVKVKPKKKSQVCRAWAVIAEKKEGTEFWVEVSLVKGNLPEVAKGEKLVRVTISI